MRFILTTVDKLMSNLNAYINNPADIIHLYSDVSACPNSGPPGDFLNR